MDPEIYRCVWWRQEQGDCLWTVLWSVSRCKSSAWFSVTNFILVCQLHTICLMSTRSSSAVLYVLCLMVDFFLQVTDYLRQILASGTTTSVPALAPEQYQNVYDALVSRVGCSGAANTFECLRTAPRDAITNASVAMFNQPEVYSRRVCFFPFLDGEFIPDLSSTSLLLRPSMAILSLPAPLFVQPKAKCKRIVRTHGTYTHDRHQCQHSFHHRQRDG
jgi:hypothetical protein